MLLDGREGVEVSFEERHGARIVEYEGRWLADGKSRDKVRQSSRYKAMPRQRRFYKKSD